MERMNAWRVQEVNRYLEQIKGMEGMKNEQKYSIKRKNEFFSI